MYVSDVMRSKLTVVGPQTSLPEAVRVARERGIRHLPVLEEGKLVGIVSDRDLKRAMASSATSLAANELTYLLDRVTVAEIMSRSIITVAPNYPVEEAARIMVQEKISALPVTEAGELVGLVTETDVLELFVRAMGAGEPSSRLDVLLNDRRSALGEVIRAVEGTGTRVISVMTLSNRDGLREAVLRVATINPLRAISALREWGYTVRGGRREG